MAKKNQDNDNEEYQFDDLDGGTMLMDDDVDDELLPSSPSPQTSNIEGSNIKRNSLIAIGIFVLAIIIYKIVASLYQRQSDKITQITPPAVIVAPQNNLSAKPTPVESKPQPVVAPYNNEFKQKIVDIEQTQQLIRSDINASVQQVSNLEKNIENLNTQINNLNRVLENLTSQVAKQTEELSVLILRSQPKVLPHISKKPRVRQIHYHIQAIIPGRAWLVGTNGSTITVRIGSKINGYGNVTLIDASQGRVLTSSGYVIKFSQEDS